jgi:hypothetical protein
LKGGVVMSRTIWGVYALFKRIVFLFEKC